jgi:hypothetical protein
VLFDTWQVPTKFRADRKQWGREGFKPLPKEMAKHFSHVEIYSANGSLQDRHALTALNFSPTPFNGH